MMNKFQCPACHSNKVTFIGDNILCLNCGRQDYLYDYRNAYDLGDYVEKPSELSEIKEQVNNLEAIVAEPGQAPRRYHNQLQQVKGEVTFLRNKVNELQAKRKPRGQY